ncbi:MAG TPA: twin-arginine translocase TatA/TatE family subunit [Solirubrobacteraceae bacterium]|nr:twin-arginine translocase TatA/TatE family subunit [Solirubrobacteraceae bacterium]
MGLDNPLHIAFLVVILLLVFGARRLPEIGRSLGSGMREFKSSVTGDRSEIGQPQSQPTLNAGAPQQQPPPPAQAPAAQAPAAQAPAAQPAATPAPEQPPVS